MAGLAYRPRPHVLAISCVAALLTVACDSRGDRKDGGEDHDSGDEDGGEDHDSGGEDGGEDHDSGGDDGNAAAPDAKAELDAEPFDAQATDADQPDAEATCTRTVSCALGWTCVEDECVSGCTPECPHQGWICDRETNTCMCQVRAGTPEGDCRDGYNICASHVCTGPEYAGCMRRGDGDFVCMCKPGYQAVNDHLCEPVSCFTPTLEDGSVPADACVDSGNSDSSL